MQTKNYELSNWKTDIKNEACNKQFEIEQFEIINNGFHKHENETKGKYLNIENSGRIEEFG